MASRSRSPRNMAPKNSGKSTDSAKLSRALDEIAKLKEVHEQQLQDALQEQSNYLAEEFARRLTEEKQKVLDAERASWELTQRLEKGQWAEDKATEIEAVKKELQQTMAEEQVRNVKHLEDTNTFLHTVIRDLRKDNDHLKDQLKQLVDDKGKLENELLVKLEVISNLQAGLGLGVRKFAQARQLGVLLRRLAIRKYCNDYSTREKAKRLLRAWLDVLVEVLHDSQIQEHGEAFRQSELEAWVKKGERMLMEEERRKQNLQSRTRKRKEKMDSFKVWLRHLSDLDGVVRTTMKQLLAYNAYCAHNSKSFAERNAFLTTAALESEKNNATTCRVNRVVVERIWKANGTIKHLNAVVQAYHSHCFKLHQQIPSFKRSEIKVTPQLPSVFEDSSHSRNASDNMSSPRVQRIQQQPRPHSARASAQAGSNSPSPPTPTVPAAAFHWNSRTLDFNAPGLVVPSSGRISSDRSNSAKGVSHKSHKLLRGVNKDGSLVKGAPEFEEVPVPFVPSDSEEESDQEQKDRIAEERAQSELARLVHAGLLPPQIDRQTFRSSRKTAAAVASAPANAAAVAPTASAGKKTGSRRSRLAPPDVQRQQQSSQQQQQQQQPLDQRTAAAPVLSLWELLRQTQHQAYRKTGS
mmetsp:Transcript_42991/g.84273  ORF Transcript_42991/g.84273 Transcript_42991/m.84273 type:complete len:636 (-) Transcript_42991:12-1919(-)